MEHVTQAERIESAYTILAGKPEGPRAAEKRIYTVLLLPCPCYII